MNKNVKTTFKWILIISGYLTLTLLSSFIIYIFYLGIFKQGLYLFKYVKDGTRFSTEWKNLIINKQNLNVLAVCYALCLVFWIVLFNYRKVIKFFDKKFSKKKEANNEGWLWNEKLNEGDKKVFDKVFKVNKKDNLRNNWLIKYEKNLKTFYVNNKDENVLVNGAAGSGKTQRVLIPNLLYMSLLNNDIKPNLIITDPKKEIIQYVGENLTNNGYDLYVLDFDNPELSMAWNPLSYAYDLVNKYDVLNSHFENELVNAYESLNNIVASLNWAKGENDQMWSNQAKKLLISLLKFFLLLAVEKDEKLKIERDYFNFETVLSLVNLESFKGNNTYSYKKEENFKLKWLDLIKYKAEDKSNPLLYYWASIYNDLKEYQTMADVTLSGILTNISAATAPFINDEKIKNLLRHTISFDIDKIVNSHSPYAVFIHYPDHKVANHFLISLVIDQIYQALIEKANKNSDLRLERRVNFILEEFGNLPKIANFDNKLSICRSRNVFFMLILQDYGQLKIYDSQNKQGAKIIRSNCQINYFLSSGDDETLKVFSQSLGKKTVQKISTSTSKNGTSTTQSDTNEELMSIADLKAKENEYIVLTKNGFKPSLIKVDIIAKYVKNDNYFFKNSDNLKISNRDREVFNIENFGKKIYPAIVLYQKKEINNQKEKLDQQKDNNKSKWKNKSNNKEKEEVVIIDDDLDDAYTLMREKIDN
ncbi:type IV secretory system conjugative DNA transfer family protein [Mycoplasmopsis gallinarum]|uniref:type IV secretory system conjugative DNA transfer family protein n=1 Tax=Mycoplasmopsis gallinarum TaxID=29557 RepID=UPI0006861B75|nr:type IV secretory system conjugative DNA transfer family protein [Mycoplasmopsis gallinarum]